MGGGDLGKKEENDPHCSIRHPYYSFGVFLNFFLVCSFFLYFSPFLSSM